MLHFVVGTIMHGYNMVERLLTIMSTQEAAVIALKMCKSICSDIKCCKSRSS